MDLFEYPDPEFFTYTLLIVFLEFKVLNEWIPELIPTISILFVLFNASFKFL